MNKPNETDNRRLVRDQFTKTAEVFGNFAVASRGVEAGKLAQMVHAGRADSVVDVACGPGTFALRFAEQARWACGVDLTPAILARAKTAAASARLSNLDFTLADAHRLPFADNSLDIAVTSYALHHMPDPAGAIAEMARVVRRGGRVGITDIFVDEDAEKAELSNLIERTRDASHTRTLSRIEFAKIFEANRLRVTAEQIQENSRAFDHWLHVAGWHRGDHAYDDARRLMESTIDNDRAGFHPRYQTAEAGGDTVLMITNTILLIAGVKT